MPKRLTPSTKLPNVTFDTNCLCGRPMTVQVTFGEPATFLVKEGHHSCGTWAKTCKAVIQRAEAMRAHN
jgi:hypothetical protein